MQRPEFWHLTQIHEKGDPCHGRVTGSQKLSSFTTEADDSLADGHDLPKLSALVADEPCETNQPSDASFRKFPFPILFFYTTFSSYLIFKYMRIYLYTNHCGMWWHKSATRRAYVLLLHAAKSWFQWQLLPEFTAANHFRAAYIKKEKKQLRICPKASNQAKNNSLLKGKVIAHSELHYQTRPFSFITQSNHILVPVNCTICDNLCPN